MVVEVAVATAAADPFDVVLVGTELPVSGLWEAEFVVVVETTEAATGRDVEMEEWAAQIEVVVVGIAAVGNAGVVEVSAVGGLEADLGNFGDTVTEIGLLSGAEVVVEVDAGLAKVDETVAVAEVVFDKAAELAGTVAEAELVAQSFVPVLETGRVGSASSWADVGEVQAAKVVTFDLTEMPAGTSEVLLLDLEVVAGMWDEVLLDLGIVVEVIMLGGDLTDLVVPENHSVEAVVGLDADLVSKPSWAEDLVVEVCLWIVNQVSV